SVGHTAGVFHKYVVSAFRRTTHGPAKAGHYVQLLLIRQLEDVQRVDRARVVDFWRYQSRNLSRAAATEPSRDGDVLLASDGERHREPLHRGSQARLPPGL